jgi:hypothetical protein
MNHVDISQANRKSTRMVMSSCACGETHNITELEHKGLVNIVAQSLSVDGAQLIRDIDPLSWLLRLHQYPPLLPTQTAPISIGIPMIIHSDNLFIGVSNHPLLFLNLHIKVIQEFSMARTKMPRVPQLLTPDEFSKGAFDKA